MHEHPSRECLREDSDLSWREHADYVCSRTSSALGCIKSHFSHLSLSCKIIFFKSYVLPIFVYAMTACARLTKWLEHVLSKHEVAGSIPAVREKKKFTPRRPIWDWVPDFGWGGKGDEGEEMGTALTMSSPRNRRSLTPLDPTTIYGYGFLYLYLTARLQCNCTCEMYYTWI